MSNINHDPMAEVFRNDLLLQKIFEFSDKSTLKFARLVSKQWNRLSLRFWRKNSVIQSRYVKHILNLKNDEDTNRQLQLARFPFKRFVLCVYDPANTQWRTGQEQKFIEYTQIADDISSFNPTHLTMEWIPYYFDGFPEILSRLLSNSLRSLEVSWSTFYENVPENTLPLDCSNVRQLKLYTTVLNDDQTSRRSLWNFLLKSCPNVEALSIKYDGNDGYSINVSDRLKIAQFLKLKREIEGECIFPIKEFELIDFHWNTLNEDLEENCRTETAIMDTLAECNFPLSKLSVLLTWYGSLYQRKLNLTLLDSCKNTLKHLTCMIGLNNGCYRKKTGSEIKKISASSNIDVVTMEVLEEVNVLNGIEWALFLLKHIQIPNLKKLKVEHDEKPRFFHDDDTKGKIKIVFPREKVLDSLETLVLEDLRPLYNKEMISTLAHFTPNLQHLTIPLDKSSFSAVCDHFKGLCSLHIVPAKGDYVDIDDEALTGMDPKKEFQNGSRLPNITNLQKLQEFSYSCESMVLKQTLKITEHSVIHGFLKLPKLFHLKVGIVNLSEDTLTKLKNHVKGSIDLLTEVEPSPREFELYIKLASIGESSSEEESEESNENAEDDESGESGGYAGEDESGESSDNVEEEETDSDISMPDLDID